MDPGLLLIGTLIISTCIGTLFGDTYGWLYLGCTILLAALIPDKWWKS